MLKTEVLKDNKLKSIIQPFQQLESSREQEYMVDVESIKDVLGSL